MGRSTPYEPRIRAWGSKGAVSDFVLPKKGHTSAYFIEQLFWHIRMRGTDPNGAHLSLR
jgi:hypothetical protein